ncbi:helix-turn-helix domain-containing protein [Streptomyces sp. NPDC048603]|uniref:helix-turn-helix domain-containing protein n=1 Tax=Streptomyces sp. NPDC048603 TaxID=3365577 RepID=UPI003712ED35
MAYTERPSGLVPGAVLWRADGPAGTVLPDGCMDLLWVDGRLLVAGPDTRAHPAREVPGSGFAGIRFAPGAAPALLGVPAYELRDRRVELAGLSGLWPAREVRALAGRVASYADPLAGLDALARSRVVAPDPLIAEVVARLRAGETVARIADTLGLGPRQLHRRSMAAFGYGAKTLGRVLRMQHALARVRAGDPYAEVAHSTGYADQAHLAREVRVLAGTTLTGYTAAATGGQAEGVDGADGVDGVGGVDGANRETPQPSGSSTTA